MNWLKRIDDCAKNKDTVRISSVDENFSSFSEQYKKYCNDVFSESFFSTEKNRSEIYSVIERGINILNNVWIDVDEIPLNSGFSPYSLISYLTIPINKYIYDFCENCDIRKTWNETLYRLAIERKENWFVQLQNMLIKKDDYVPTELIFVIYNCEKLLTDVGKCFKSDVFDEFLRLTEEKYRTDKINVLERYEFCTSRYSKHPDQISHMASRHRNIKLLRTDIRKAENNIREALELPGVGKGWISESVLFQEIQQAFPEFEVIQHAHLPFLGQQHYDIFIPKIKIAIEYQGIQHSRPVDYFGGEEAWRQNLERDKRKKQLSDENGIRIVYVYPDYCLENVLNEINDFISKTYQINNRLSYVDLGEIEKYRVDLQNTISNLKKNTSLSMKQKELKEKKRAIEKEKWKQFYHYDGVPSFSAEDETVDTLREKERLMKHYKHFDIPLEVCHSWSLQIRKMLRDPGKAEKLMRQNVNLNLCFLNLLIFHKKLKEYDTCVGICREALALGLPNDDNLERMTSIYGIYRAYNYEEIIKDLTRKKH